ncbi:MAG: hypothetical protein V4520_07110 [Bacteroidota bacterium]
MTQKEAYVAPEPLKPVYRTLTYYAIAIAAVCLFNILPGFKSGPCSPNFDVLSAFVLFGGSIILLGVNLVRLKVKGRAYLPSVLIHLFIFISCLVFSLVWG